MHYSVVTNIRWLLLSSRTHLTTPNQSFVEMRWRSLFQSTYLDKRCTSYNASPTSRKRAAERWSLRNFLPQNFIFMVGKAQKSHGSRSELYGGCSNGVSSVHFFEAKHRIQFRSRSTRFMGFFRPWKGKSEARNLEVINGLQHFFEKWVELCKKCIAFQGRYFKKRPSPHLHKKFRLRVIRWVHELFK
jgi:hypothetical protein